MVVVTPILLLVSGKVRIAINKFVCFIFYIPVALIAVCVFTLINMCLTPVAYLAAIASKAKLLRLANKLKVNTVTQTSDLFKFVILGIPILIVTCVQDVLKFS